MPRPHRAGRPSSPEPLRRGDVHLVEFDPPVGTRPVIVLSSDRANLAALLHGRAAVSVVPVTSNVERVYPSHVIVAAGVGGLALESKVQTEHLCRVPLHRVRRRLGAVPAALLEAVDRALRAHHLLLPR